jgi:hypothetical protein
MKNSNVPAKSRGAVIFAHNTPTVDYKRIAEQAARLIKYNLNLPVTIITDTDDMTNVRIGYAGGTPWYNMGRYRGYTLSPYDETILLDSDYLVLDDSLLKILDTANDYTIMNKNQSPIGTIDTPGMLSIQSVWATVVVFKKTSKAKLLFDLVGRIQRNYGYYKSLYNLNSANFRNDYAFAIADNILNGYTPSPGIPWSMLTIDKPIRKIEVKNNNLVVREAERAHVLPKQNIHIIDKDYLQSKEYKDFVDLICQTN